MLFQVQTLQNERIYKERIYKAIYKEIKNLVANDLWELVERPKDVNVVECRTILKNKQRMERMES